MPQAISQDRQKRMEYEAREKAVRDYNQAIFEAEQRKAIEIAKTLIGMGYQTAAITQTTGLPENLVGRLR